MKNIHHIFGFGALVAVTLGSAAVGPATPASAQIAVFDGSNYAQNLLQAARALNQVNNQIKSLQNEATMLQNMAKNLKRLDFPQLAKLSSAMSQINQLMSQAHGIQFRVAGLDQQVQKLFPGLLEKALTGDQRLALARAQLDAATAAYRQAMSVQAQIAENVQADASSLSEIVQSSQRAEGALEAEQAANQLLSVSVKQQLQLENLMTLEFREAAIDRARRAQAEDDGRALTLRFLRGGGASGN
jgi:P-type conjugative transfer protein TrbJ